MADLLSFLMEHPVDDLQETFKLSKRIPYDFTIRALSNEEMKEFRKQSIKTIKGKPEVDMDKLQDLTCAACTIEPNFNNAEVIKKAKVSIGRELVSKLLLPGEKDELYKRIATLSGYDTGIDEAVEAAKN